MFDDFSDSKLVTLYARSSGLELASPHHVAGLRAVTSAIVTRAIQQVVKSGATADRRVAAALSTARKALAMASGTQAPARASTIQGRVLAAAGVACTVAELAAAAGVTRKQAQSAVQRLFRAGRLDRGGAAGAYRYRESLLHPHHDSNVIDKPRKSEPYDRRVIDETRKTC